MHDIRNELRAVKEDLQTAVDDKANLEKEMQELQAAYNEKNREIIELEGAKKRLTEMLTRDEGGEEAE